jgi:hypothetical protein
MMHILVYNFSALNNQLNAARSTFEDYFFVEGFLFKGRQLCIPAGSVREKKIQELHSSGLGGHFGRDISFSLVHKRFFWPQMRKERCCLSQIM